MIWISRWQFNLKYNFDKQNGSYFFDILPEPTKLGTFLEAKVTKPEIQLLNWLYVGITYLLGYYLSPSKR